MSLWSEVTWNCISLLFRGLFYSQTWLFHQRYSYENCNLFQGTNEFPYSIPPFWNNPPYFFDFKNCSLLQTVTTSPIRGMGEGNSFSLLVYPHPGEGVPTLARSRQGEGIPQGTYPRPGQDREEVYPKAPTPLPGQDGGYPKVPTSLPLQRSGWGGDTPRYLPPARSGWGRGYPKVPTPLARSG